MNEFEDLLNDLNDDGLVARERRVHVRNSPHGEHTDFVETTETVFVGGAPETTKEFRASGPLPCGHQVDGSNHFGGYCQGGPLNRPCHSEFCQQCGVSCPRCGRTVSRRCCAHAIDGVLHCKRCHGLHLSLRIAGWGVTVVLLPLRWLFEDSPAPPPSRNDERLK